MISAPWWRHAVVHQVYVRSFADSDGDGLGDLPGITARLDHLADLGVDAVWLTPFYTSPQHDHGYDVADYTGVDPRFGTMADLDALVARAHALRLRVVVDLVPNHTSSEHPWFPAALAAAPGSPERDRYLFRTGRNGGDEPPNNWGSMFGGPAWTRVEGSDQWYLHLFDTTQPDLNWRNPEVGEMFADVLRFWLDRGVDGFRIDVAHGLYKEESLRDKVDTAPVAEATSMVDRPLQDEPMFDQPEVHEVYRSWRRILDSYPGERMAVAEAWTQTPEAMARYIRPDELHQSFNFAWLSAPWSAEAFRTVVTDTLAAVAPVGASATWVLSNHDVVRHPTRYGGGPVGLARARAATLTMLGLPGSSYLYQGEELGLEEVNVPEEARQDPAWFRMGLGRDGCRVPIPWSGDAPPYGFGPGEGQPWLPQPEGWSTLSVEAEQASADSTLTFYRRTLAARRRHLVDAPEEIAWLDLGDDVLAFVRGGVTVVLNCGTEAVPLPEGVALAASGPVTDGLPPDTAVWLR
ncbi:MAG: glycoside hydrolase family 13 protein [Nocardioides sp.]|uniref:glycoside hydrolase family 13 protein n=1 Tax=Nocardioides sp. TaxID=35761 RepID=UPI003F0A956F